MKRFHATCRLDAMKSFAFLFIFLLIVEPRKAHHEANHSSLSFDLDPNLNPESASHNVANEPAWSRKCADDSQCTHVGKMFCNQRSETCECRDEFLFVNGTCEKVPCADDGDCSQRYAHSYCVDYHCECDLLKVNGRCAPPTGGTGMNLGTGNPSIDRWIWIVMVILASLTAVGGGGVAARRRMLARSRARAQGGNNGMMGMGTGRDYAMGMGSMPMS